jgi:hypothetical protein
MGRPCVYPVPASLEEAEFYRDAGVAPLRPRNVWEKKAKLPAPKGRPSNTHSKTRMAVELARYLMETDGLSRRAAAKKAAVAYQLKAPDAVLKHLRKVLAGPQVMVKPRARGNHFDGLQHTQKLPLLVETKDAQIEPFKVYV